MEITTDDEFKKATSQLYDIAKSHSLNEYNEEDINRAMNILNHIKRYAHDISSERSVQMAQIENNISDIRQVLNQPAKEGHFPYAANYIDNLGRYCGIQI